MGGAFDPIHIGHLLAAEAAREQHELDEVWFMPSHIPPHKHQAGLTGEQRLEMVNVALEGHPTFRSLDLELSRGGISYTIDTIRQLKQLHPDHVFYFIIGADMVNYLPKWESIEQLVKMITFIGLRRPGSPLELTQLPLYIQDNVLLAQMPLIDISSSLIRERIEEGKSVRYMMPDKVYDYITRSGAYEVH